MVTIPLPDVDSYTVDQALAGQTEFEFDFRVWSKADLDVYVQWSQLASAEWSFTPRYDGEGQIDGGRITLSEPCAYGDIVSIVRNVAADRPAEFDPGRFSYDALNAEMNRMYAMIQDLRRELDHGLFSPYGELLKRLEPADQRRGRFPVWSDDGLALLSTNAFGGGGGNGGGGPIITDPTEEGPLVDYIDQQIQEYQVILEQAIALRDQRLDEFTTAVDGLDSVLTAYGVQLDSLSAGLTGRVNDLEIVTGDTAALLTQVQTLAENTQATVLTLQLTTAEGNTQLISDLNTRVGDVENSVTSILSTSAEQASAILALQASDGDASSLIQSLQTVSADQATSLTNQQTLIDGINSQVGSLQTTTADHASRLGVIEFANGEITNRIVDLEEADEEKSLRLSTLETSSSSALARISTLEQTSAEGNAVVIQQLQSEQAGLRTDINSVLATSAANASSIQSLTSQGINYLNRIQSLEQVTTNQATSVNHLSVRVGGVEAKAQEALTAAVSASGKVDLIWGIKLTAGDVIGGLQIGNNGRTVDAVFSVDSLKVNVPGSGGRQVFSIVGDTLRAYNVEVDTIAANSITTENLKVGSVSEKITKAVTNVSLNTNATYKTVISDTFVKARGGLMEVSYLIDAVVNSNVTKPRADVEIWVGGILRVRHRHELLAVDNVTRFGFDHTLQGAGSWTVELRVKVFQAGSGAGITSASLPNVKMTVGDLKA